VLNKHLPRGDKLEDRTFEGFLLSYNASNIYRVWLSATNRVIRVRDVRFIDELYKDKPSTSPASPQVIKTAHIPEEEYDSDTIVVAQPIRQRQVTVTSSSSPLEKQIQQLPSPTTTARSTPDHHGTPDRRGTPDRHSTSPDPCGTSDHQDHDSPDPVKQQLSQESSAASQHITPGG
jgi:hypothetical protein